MQAENFEINMSHNEQPYTAHMPRELSKARPAVGSHLLELRKAAGLSQYELAGMLGVKQQTVAFWEQSDSPPRSQILPQMAKALGVKIEEIINGERVPVRRGGPSGKARSLFERVSRLPRRQQEHILDVVAALVDRRTATQ